MEEIIGKLFSEYISNQSIAGNAAYAALAEQALKQEKALRESLGSQEVACFEKWAELTAEIHFLEVKDAFVNACKLGARLQHELIT